MKLEIFLSLVVAPGTSILGIYVLIRCVSGLRRVIFPKVKHRFSASVEPYSAFLPTPGRYVVGILIPPLTFITGTSHFAALFSVKSRMTGASIGYRSYGRSLFQVTRTDMSGRKAIPLGSFECPAVGDVEITCLNPETVRPDFQLEISPYVSPLHVVPLILATIISSAMMIGGTVIFILGIAGKI